MQQVEHNNRLEAEIEELKKKLSDPSMLEGFPEISKIERQADDDESDLHARIKELEIENEELRSSQKEMTQRSEKMTDETKKLKMELQNSS